MEQLTVKDLERINLEYLIELQNNELIQVTLNLRDNCIHLHERLNQNSKNSSKPPSSDNPFKRRDIRNGKKYEDDSQVSPVSEKNGKDLNPTDQHTSTSSDKLIKGDSEKTETSDKSSQPPTERTPELGKSFDSNTETESTADTTESNKADQPVASDKTEETASDQKPKRNPGRQLGSQGFWRSDKPDAEFTENHYPDALCASCGKTMEDAIFTPHAGHYTYELEKEEHGIRIVCTLHRYYQTTCECGHENKAQPGEGYVSILDNRKSNLKLTEYTIVGPMLTTFIAALNRRCGMSREKIREFLLSWFNFELSIGTICRCIREAGIACYPVVDQLIEQLQNEKSVQTPWYQKGVLGGLWVAISKQIAVYHIGTRKKAEILNLITEAFVGWLITDGYMGYRFHEKRQRCLAHLIRKAVALTGATDQKAVKMGDWFLRELRDLIHEMAQGEDGTIKCRPILARLKKACLIGSESDHDKLKSLAKEILNDWDAVVAFVKNPGLPATNNEAERALRWAVILRRITFGTRTDEGSRSFSAIFSVIETCRLRNVDPWEYISKVIASGRKGQTPPSLPSK